MFTIIIPSIAYVFWLSVLLNKLWPETDTPVCPALSHWRLHEGPWGTFHTVNAIKYQANKTLTSLESNPHRFCTDNEVIEPLNNGHLWRFQCGLWYSLFWLTIHTLHLITSINVQNENIKSSFTSLWHHFDVLSEKNINQSTYHNQLKVYSRCLGINTSLICRCTLAKSISTSPEMEKDPQPYYPTNSTCAPTAISTLLKVIRLNTVRPTIGVLTTLLRLQC